MKQNSKNWRKGERGNVLFLILIAVALFAALSYAVTQSTRSGGGDASSETNLINSAQITQYPAGVRTAVVRMLIGGISMDQLYFNPPSSFDGQGNPALALLDDINDEKRAVFHPLGGGAVFAQGPMEVLTTTQLALANAREWIFTADYEIDRIGTSDSSATTAGNDLIAFLPGITLNMCKKLNEEVGIGLDGSNNIPDAGVTVTPLYATHHMIKQKTPPIALTEVDRIEGTFFQGQPFGCFRIGAAPGVNVYYHVIVEQ